MLEFLAQNGGSLLVAALLTAVLTAVIFSLRRNRKKGSTSCGCNCGQCPSAGICRGKTEQ